MTQGDLLRKLFQGYVKRDDSVFHGAAQEIIENERAKNHKILADQLQKILLNGNGSSRESRLISRRYEIPVDRESQLPLLEIAEYAFDWERVVLPAKTIKELQRITTEHRKKDLLAAGGMKPKQKVLFFGPPGCGKTITAKVMSSVLYYPLVTVRFDALVSSLLGETATNLRKVFDFIERGTWVVLFDEFDAIGKDRDNQFEHGELKRVVNSLLQLMDAFHGESLLIAATNHERLLDNAIWRRFEAVIPFQKPSLQDRYLLLQQFLNGFDYASIDMHVVARGLDEATGHDIEWLSKEIARTALLEGRTVLRKQDVETALSAYKERKDIFDSQLH